MMSHAGFSSPAPGPAPGRASRLVGAVGRRNAGYVAFLLALAAILLGASVVGPRGSAGVAVAAGVFLVALAASLAFFALNALLVLGWVVDQLWGWMPVFRTPVSHALIGCALPVVILGIGMVFVP